MKLPGLSKFSGIFGRAERRNADAVEIYRHWECRVIGAEDWHMALLILREMGWTPGRPLDAYRYPLSFVQPDEAEAMGAAGRALFREIEKEPGLSASVQMDLGLFHEILMFVSEGSFIIGRPGDMERAKSEIA